MEQEDKKPSRGSATDILANERTFLAWVRTALGVVALGFVIVKFSLFISQMKLLLNQQPARSLYRQEIANITGISMLVLGCIILILSYIRYNNTDKQLHTGKVPVDKKLPLFTSVSLVLAVLLLIVYLVISTLTSLPV